MNKVAIVEDDPMFAEVAAWALSQERDMQVVGNHRCAEVALVEIPKHCPDVILMDISLPGISGIECLRQLKRSGIPGQVLMLSGCEEGDLVFESLRAGAEGYVSKHGMLLHQFVEAVRDVRMGGGVLTSSIARKVIGYFRQEEADKKKFANAQDALSAREKEVLTNLARGKTYKEIAGDLTISIDTVRKHTGSIYRKIHVRSRTEATSYYLRNGGKL